MVGLSRDGIGWVGSGWVWFGILALSEYFIIKVKGGFYSTALYQVPSNY